MRTTTLVTAQERGPLNSCQRGLEVINSCRNKTLIVTTQVTERCLHKQVKMAVEVHSASITYDIGGGEETILSTSVFC